MMARRFPRKSERESGRAIAPAVLMAPSIFQSAGTSAREKHRQDCPAPECTVRQMRRAIPNCQAYMAAHAVLGPIVPDGEFHEATTGRIAIHSARYRPGRWILLWPIFLGNGIITKESGNDIKDILTHSVMIQREWSRKEPISFPLCRRNESCRMEW